MAFVTALIMGVLVGMFSWLALAAWLEARRAWLENPSSNNRPASSGQLGRLHQQPAHS
jgi:hypothetical protein